MSWYRLFLCAFFCEVALDFMRINVQVQWYVFYRKNYVDFPPNGLTKSCIFWLKLCLACQPSSICLCLSNITNDLVFPILYVMKYTLTFVLSCFTDLLDLSFFGVHLIVAWLLKPHAISYHELLWRVNQNRLPGFYLWGLPLLLLNHCLSSFCFFDLESITKKVAKPVLCMLGNVRDLTVWKLPLPVGAWKERKSWSLNSVLVSSRETLSGMRVCWLKSLF